VTQVTSGWRSLWGTLLLLLLLTASGTAPQATAQTSAAAQAGAQAAAAPKPAEELYLQLQKVGLDPARTYHIREAALDWPGLHLTLEDGEICFTNDVAGKITGAFFEGDGEVLLSPPNKVERASMALFTGMAILEDRFTTAYFRFNDDMFGELQPHLRPTSDGQDFASRWNDTAVHLGELDAMRLLVSFSGSLPVAGKPAHVSGAAVPGRKEDDRFLHARVESPLLGAYDLFYDGKAFESVVAGQTKTVAGITYYDIWTSFRAQAAVSRGGQSAETPPPDEVEIQSYKINTQVNPPTTLSADATLKMRVRRGGARTLMFELSRFLQVKQVEVNGRPVEFINNPALEGTQLARRGNDEVAVVFDEPLQQGQDLSVRFVYGGDVLSEAGGGLLYVGARGAWYPGRGLIPCDYELDFRYPAGWTLIATGKRVAGSANGEAEEGAHGEREAKWITDRPIALAGFNLGKYERASARAGKIEIDTYAARGVERTFPHLSVSTMPPPEMPRSVPTPPGPVVHAEIDPSPARNAQKVADEAAQALTYFSEKFAPYPYSSLELTQMPGSASQGWPGLIFLSSMSFLSPAEAAGLRMSPEQSAMRKLMLPHETAHQWWGDLVLWKSYRDQWLVEALANYSALMMVEKENPTEFRQVLESYRADLQEKNKDGEPLGSAGPVTLGQRLNSSHFPTGYEAISYGRGTWLFHMLRYMLLDGEALSEKRGTEPKPEEPFVRALRKVCVRYAGRPISTQELIAVFAEELPPSLRYEKQKSLDWFIDSWVEGTALPHFSLRGVKITKGTSVSVSGTIVEKDAPDDLVTPVPIYAVVGGRDVLLGRVFVDSAETPFHLTAPAGAGKLLVDPNGTLLTSRR